MDDRFALVSLNGRMAYVIMCVEAFLVHKYPDRDWTFVSEKMWKATSDNWGDWTDEFSAVIPDVLLQYTEYDSAELGRFVTENEFRMLKTLYGCITAGHEDDPSDELNYMLNKPFEMAMVYEGTGIGDGAESIRIIEEAESILRKSAIPLPDCSEVLFSSSNEFHGWGNRFDGKPLSVILK